MKLEVPTIEELLRTRDQLQEKIKAYKTELDETNGMLMFILKTTPNQEAFVDERRVYIEHAVSVTTKVEEARAFDAVVVVEDIDKEKLLNLFAQGNDIPGVIEVEKIKVVTAKIRKEKEAKEAKKKKGLT